MKGHWISVSSLFIPILLTYFEFTAHFLAPTWGYLFGGTFLGAPFWGHLLGAPFGGTFWGHLIWGAPNLGGTFLLRTITYIITIWCLFIGFREQMNQITSFSDASNVYGSDLCEMRELRVFHGGKLNSTRYLNISFRKKLPFFIFSYKMYFS